MIEKDDPAVDPHFKVIHRSDGRFHWELINPHGASGSTPAIRPVIDQAPRPKASVLERWGSYSESVRGRLPLQEALRDELSALLLAPAVQHLEI
jgi:hypothetical protein